MPSPQTDFERFQAQLKLTPGQKRVRDAWCRYHDQHGYWPTLREAAAFMGLNHVTIQEHLLLLERKGAAERLRGEGARTWGITRLGWKPNRPYRIAVAGKVPRRA